MYANKISMATLAGHGIGGKIALATACYHHDKVTGYFGIDTVPYNQYFF
jgi:pimeloyl-ACP methyl ester carboxylesterase